MAYPELQILPAREKSILGGHPWVFSGSLAQKTKIPDGQLVHLCIGQRVLATGYYNSRTDIAVRILSKGPAHIDAVFFRKRFAELLEAKKPMLPADTDSFRLVFGESDGCPGLIVDVYGNVLVAQFHTLGMDRLKPLVVSALIEALAPRAIVERSDVGIRRMEGLEDMPVGMLYGDPVSEIEIRESGLRFGVNVMEGQKTGFFLDQRENRRAIRNYCANRRVLNCFSYTGGFSVYAGTAGAKAVTSVDISKPATEQCRKNFALNGLDSPDHEFIAQDVFDYLKALEPGAFDFIILDPPSFAKNKKQLTNAIKAYTTINSKALEKLPLGGFLVSASCTSHVDPLTFLKILHQSAVNARCTVKVVENREQPFDHAYNLAFPEGRYLKFVILRKSA